MRKMEITAIFKKLSGAAKVEVIYELSLMAETVLAGV
jgi:hypothetical protein